MLRATVGRVLKIEAAASFLVNIEYMNAIFMTADWTDPFTSCAIFS